MDDEIEEEPIVCSSCETTPQLFYKPPSDEPYRLRCECDMASADVTDCLNESKLVETFSGKWSNMNYDSKLRNNNRP